MKCQKCGKNNASTHFVQNINGESTELWLCSDCAEEMGIGGMFSGLSDFGAFDPFGAFSNPFSAFEEMLGGLFGMPSIVFKTGGQAIKAPDKCPLCGSTFEEIAGRGKAGCPECYEHFADKLAPSIERLHGTRTHTLDNSHGSAAARRRPDVKPDTKPDTNVKSADNAETIAELRRLLNEAVAAEEYEKAAEIHAKIKKLEARS